MQNSNNKSKFVSKAKAGRSVYSALLPLLYLIACYKVGVTSVLLFIPFAMIVTLLFMLPFFINVHKIKQATVASIKPFILDDLLFSALPSIATAFFASLAMYIFFDGFQLIWMFSSTAIVLFVVFTLYIWLVYWINNSIAKKLKKFNQ